MRGNDENNDYARRVAAPLHFRPDASVFSLCSFVNQVGRRHIFDGHAEGLEERNLVPVLSPPDFPGKEFSDLADDMIISHGAF